MRFETLSAVSSSSTPKKLRIVYAEDSPMEQELLTMILSKRGHGVTCFGDGKSALQAIMENAYDVLITDHDMPCMTGLTLVSELRRINFPIKIVVTSGFLDDDVEARYRAFGIERFLQKPSPEDEILRAVEED